jgi:hypothetical protein
LKENRTIGTHKMLIVEVISEDQIMPPKSSKEIKEIGIGMIKNSKPLSKTTLLLMKERMTKLILKYIALVTPLHLLI